MSKGKLFISYKTGRDNGLSQIAQLLNERLNRDGYDVWLDNQNLIAGARWDDQIFFEQIPIRDVVLLLLSEPVRESKAIRREIEIASRVGVSIIPVLIRGDFDVNEVLNTLELDNVQYVEFKEAKPHEYEELLKQIDANVKTTRTKRDENLIKMAKQGEEKPGLKAKFTPDSQYYRTYTLPDVSADECKVYLAAGDLTQMCKINVLVNSENTYMQMARVFETDSLSSNLRWRGSLVKGGQLKEDTVQLELNDQIMSEDYHIPITPGYVIPTHAGHPESELVAELEARYIFHVASVSVEPTRDYRMIPVDNRVVEEAVRNCFREVIKVNKNKGVISPANSPRREHEEASKADYKNITSIIFPLFATGQGGRTSEVAKIAETMVKKFIECYNSNKTKSNFTISEIYLCAYSIQDVQRIEEVMNRHLVRV